MLQANPHGYLSQASGSLQPLSLTSVLPRLRSVRSLAPAHTRHTPDSGMLAGTHDAGRGLLTSCSLPVVAESPVLGQTLHGNKQPCSARCR